MLEPVLFTHPLLYVTTVTWVCMYPVCHDTFHQLAFLNCCVRVCMLQMMCLRVKDEKGQRTDPVRTRLWFLTDNF